MIDTSNENKDRQDLTQFDEIWLFGYGSLIYKVDFPFIEKIQACINGWQRRFWQGSHDHRGTPEQPGRVVTLIPAKKDDITPCHGMAYRVSPEVFEHLDHREKNGYLRHEIAIEFKDGSSKQGLIYIADEKNPAFLGEASVEDIANQILMSRGPSGENSEYLFKLAQSLRVLNAVDHHVFEIEARMKNDLRNCTYLSETAK